MNKSNFKYIISSLLLLGSVQCCSSESLKGEEDPDSEKSTYSVTITPQELSSAIRNPMKGFTSGSGKTDHPLATTTHTYLKWNELENVASDGVDKIKAVCDAKWAGIEAKNFKVIPRVYLHYSGDNQKYWPQDMIEDDYASAQFQTRLKALVAKLGECWNNDPRVAFIELGIFGKWGEQHSPTPTATMQKIAGEAFTKAFPDKKVSVRQMWADFTDFEFGEYWDSWAHYDQMYSNGDEIRKVNDKTDRYLTNYIGGEVAYDWGNGEIQPGKTPTESVKDPSHRAYVINSINWLHCTQFRWIDAYDQSDAEAVAGAQEIQKALGYRYVINEFKFGINKDKKLSVAFDVTNIGAAPFYYNWPVQIALLDPSSKKVVWSSTMQSVDIRDWKPGARWTNPDWSGGKTAVDWGAAEQKWGKEPAVNTEKECFEVDAADGEYIIAISGLDPAANLPSLRFATANYLNGGYHPMGIVEIGGEGSKELPTNFKFDDPVKDNSLHY